MYGMLLESVQHFVQTEFGEQIWNEALIVAECKHTSFKTHQVYPDKLMPDLAQALSAITGKSFDYFMNFFGKCFVRFFSNFGYEKIIRSSGRYFCDFLQSMDNLHLQMRFTYPKMRSPSMQLTSIDENGAILVYRSSRSGFSKYLMGQLNEIATSFYNLELKITVIESENDHDGGTVGPINLSERHANQQHVVVKYRLDFDNRDFMANRICKDSLKSQNVLEDVDLKVLLELFPFTIILDHNLNITDCGEKLLEIFILHNPDKPPTSFIGSHIKDNFTCRRPKGLVLEWENILQLKTVLFELELTRTGTTEMPAQCADRKYPMKSTSSFDMSQNTSKEDLKEGCSGDDNQPLKNILLKGQMYFIKDIDSIIFLCSPLINNLDELRSIGLYLNDLNPHGLSRELVLAGWQHYSKLELLFEKEEQRSDELEKSLDLADQWKKKGDELLFSMLPRPIAERMRTANDPLTTCQSFEEVSVIFGEVLNINAEGNIQDAMDAVSTLNAIFSSLDEEILSPFIYKVETVGMVYMAVSGAPDINPMHAEHAADFALRIIKKVKSFDFPEISIKIGIHSGPVVAGVVGLKVPRWCLFGDTVNTASRMESSGECYKIQVSSTTAKKLKDLGYELQYRGHVKVKGKGDMETYWLLDGPNL